MENKFWCLVLFGCILSLQQAQGSWIEKQLGYYLSPIVQPITEAAEILQTNLDEIETRKQELITQKKKLKDKMDRLPKGCRNEELLNDFAFFDKWDFDSCVNLTDDMKLASVLALQGSGFARNLSEIVGSYGGLILDCSNEEYDKIFPCYNRNLKALKSEIEQSKTETVPLVHDSVLVARDMRRDFDQCIGIPQTLKERIEMHIENIKC